MKKKWRWFIEALTRLGKAIARARGTSISGSKDTDIIWEDGEPHKDR